MLFDKKLETELINRFRLKNAYVLVEREEESYSDLRHHLAMAAAQTLRKHLSGNIVIGLSWGTFVSETIKASETQRPLRGVRVVQLLGALGARLVAHDGHVVVQELAQKLGGEGIYLSAPYIVESSEIAISLLSNPSLREWKLSQKQCDLVLTGIGTIDPMFSSLYQGGHISLQEIEDMKESGIVGDVCGHHFDVKGKAPENTFSNRIVGIAKEDFLSIPTRLAVSGGTSKILPILGALRGRYVTDLVTDNHTAAQVLQLDEN
jgi:deoxyribonucleoside regulator